MTTNLNREQLIEQYKLLHSQQKGYGAGATFGNRIWHLIEAFQCKSVMDFGCGKGALIEFLKKKTKVPVTGWDPSVFSFRNEEVLHHEYDMVIANDVFEHFHPEHLYEEIYRVFRMARVGVFLNISCRPAVHKLPNGDNCHTALLTPEEWIKKISLVDSDATPIIQQLNPVNRNLILFYLKNHGLKDFSISP